MRAARPAGGYRWPRRSSRVGLGGPGEAALENGFGSLIPDALPREVVRYVVREMSKTFPAIVERLSTFRVIPVTSAVPTTVAQYACEASRCYLHGSFSACLILCRSCVESAIETRLRQRGLGKAIVRPALQQGAGTAQVRGQLRHSGRPDVLHGRRDSQERQQGRPAPRAVRPRQPFERNFRARANCW